MIFGRSFMTLLFVVFMFFYQQLLANDTYDLEEFREYHKTNSKLPSNQQQKRTGQSPLENIRIGFVRLDLASEDVSGDGRLEICEGYEVDEQDFKRLIEFFFEYANMGDPQYRKVYIQKALRLMRHMFTMNINKTMEQSPEEKQIIEVTAKSLFEKMFFSEYTNGGINPYFNYFYSDSAASHSNYAGLNNRLVLMFLTFLGPYFLTDNDFYIYFTVLLENYVENICDQALTCALFSENISECNSPESFAHQFTEARLDTETALLIGLTAMASAAFDCMNSGLEWPETLETLLQTYLPYELSCIINFNMAKLCSTCPVLPAMYSVDGMQEFTNSILGIKPAPSPALSSESLNTLTDYSRDSGSEASGEELHADRQNQSTAIHEQSDLVAQLQRPLASQSAMEGMDAVGGASGETKRCSICCGAMTEMMTFENCEHAGFCEICAERITHEQSGCPFCRIKSKSYKKVIDTSFH
ncbi:RING-HC finger protein [Endozoicomonas sp. ONNA1]|uniref:RING-HC finger protein n=2 Tax=unclassified Endozoicomonas TaxID=2644528 RepID=UPI002149985D|nr:RING-HC finger protein [Endozoicomonas sp. ONNA1]